MRYRWTFVAISALALVGLAGCGLLSQPPAATPTVASGTPTAVAATPLALGTIAATETATTTAGLTTTLALTATVTPSPLPTLVPTPETPTATPEPTLSPEMVRALGELQTRLEDFQMSVRSQDRTAVLRGQRDVLDALSKAERLAPPDDGSALSQRVKSALGEVRAGVSGDLAKLGSAQGKLRQLTGRAAVAGETAVATPGSGLQPVTDLPTYAGNLADKVKAFSAAYRGNRTGDLLRLQTQLVDEMNRGEVSLKGDSSRLAGQIRDAIADVRNGLGGDVDKLNAAEAKLRQLSGQPGDVAISDDLSASPSPTPRPADVQPLANELSNRLGPVRDAVRSANPDNQNLAQVRKDLAQQIDKTEQALAGDTSPRAERLRRAMGILREVASGDNTKIDAAERALKAAGQ